MKRAEWLHWLSACFEVGPAGAALLEEVMAAIEESVPAASRAEQRYESALNDIQLFTVVKLVHVTELSDDPRSGWTTGGGRHRLELVQRLMALANRATGAAFDLDGYEAIHRRVLRAGFESWYPTLGFEYEPSRHRVPEMSLYSQHCPREVAGLLAEVLEVPLQVPGHSLADLHAVGLDFFPTGERRFKLYFSEPAALAPELLAQVAPAHRPDRVLLLFRTEPGSAFRSSAVNVQAKAYLQLIDTAQGRIRGEDLFVVAVAGRLRRLTEDVGPALRGQWLSFLSASSDKAEVYFGGF